MSVFFSSRSGSAQTEEGPAPAAFKPVMPLFVLMMEQERHFGAIRDLIRNEGEEDRFEKLRQAAYALAEMGNINGYHRGAIRNADYREWANDLKVKALEIAELAKDSKVDEITQVAKQINATCKACHDVYQ